MCIHPRRACTFKRFNAFEISDRLELKASLFNESTIYAEPVFFWANNGEIKLVKKNKNSIRMMLNVDMDFNGPYDIQDTKICVILST